MVIKDIWSTNSSRLQVDFLLPNGLLVTLECPRDVNISQMKQKLWDKAVNLPFAELLFESATYYGLQFINQRGEPEEATDESKRLCDLRPFASLFKIFQRVGIPQEKQLDQQINEVIGSKLDFSHIPLKDEIEDFRRNLQRLCHQIVTYRANSSEEDRANYLYKPPMVSPHLPLYLKERYEKKDTQLLMIVYFWSDDRIDDSCSKFTVSIPYKQTPSQLVQQVLKIKAKKSGISTVEDYEKYVLKAIGRDEYLISEIPLHQYKFIRQSMTRDESPVVLLKHRSEMSLSECDPPIDVNAPPPLPKKIDMQTKTLWDIDAKFHMELLYVSDPNADDEATLRIKACLYHGEEPLCPIVQTNDVKASFPVWNEQVKFDIDVADIPRMTRLCVVLYEKRRAKKRKSDIPLSWVNIMLFDHKGVLKSGDQNFTLWPSKKEMESELNPRDVVGPNPIRDKSGTLAIKFHSYGEKVMYPSFPTVLQLAADYAETELGSLKTNSMDTKQPPKYSHARDQATIAGLIEGDALKVMSENEKELLWGYRVKCLDVSKSLPKLLQSLRWNRREEVAQMQALLQIWTELSPEDALELLDYKFADHSIREFAVRCLKKLTDDELAQYLLQLVQALKYESYLDCAISRFLMERALLNRRIGHFFFWYLRAEMHDPAVVIRFSMLLDAYLRFNQSHMEILKKQVDVLSDMQKLNEEMKNLSENIAKDKEERHRALRSKLNDPRYFNALSNFYCPLSPSCKAGNLRIKECKVMDSKMKPLWLVFENASDHFSGGNHITRNLVEPVAIMYKNGDDLRQDMLTLQTFKIMENIWQEGGLDLRMIPYGSMSTGKDCGLIEIVTKSVTLAKIHKEIYGNTTGALKKDTLYIWMKKKNSHVDEFRKAQMEFKCSCAAYCVATYILGVGDRHSDNIMVRYNGQLFHIDFGHFLGNFKYKFGIKRERVPFILTPDFTHVVKSGRDDSSNTEFAKFSDLCDKAFQLIRRKGNMFINLFNMMVSAGIPELSSSRDINYLIETLKLSATEEDAIKNFQGKYNEAVRNGWKASINWAIHNHVRDN